MARKKIRRAAQFFCRLLSKSARVGRPWVTINKQL
jgi:hypothetical protein